MNWEGRYLRLAPLTPTLSPLSRGEGAHPGQHCFTRRGSGTQEVGPKLGSFCFSLAPRRGEREGVRGDASKVLVNSEPKSFSVELSELRVANSWPRAEAHDLTGPAVRSRIQKINSSTGRHCHANATQERWSAARRRPRCN